MLVVILTKGGGEYLPSTFDSTLLLFPSCEAED